MPIQDWITDPIATERHEVHVDASPERAVQIALELPAGGEGIVSRLTRMRGMKQGGTMEKFFVNNGFVFLAREPREVVVGIGSEATLRHAKMLTSAADWPGWGQPNSIRAAANFSAKPEGDGSRLTTETWVDATDEKARRRFRLYWAAVGPFSKLIRRRWLRQIAARAAAE